MTERRRLFFRLAEDRPLPEQPQTPGTDAVRADLSTLLSLVNAEGREGKQAHVQLHRLAIDPRATNEELRALILNGWDWDVSHNPSLQDRSAVLDALRQRGTIYAQRRAGLVE